MKEFKTTKEAKDFLAARIASEAEREGIPLSEVERKMLYFSETNWTLPDIWEVSAEFDRDYNDDDYEQKIAGLVRRIEARNHSENPAEEKAWDEAVVKLSEGDNYLSVLITMVPEAKTVRHGFIPMLDVPAVRPPHDRLKLWITALTVVIVIFTVVALYFWMFGH